MHELPPGAPRRRLGNFRTPQLARRVREVLDAAGIQSSSVPDPKRPDPVGRWLDWLVHMTGTKGNRVWVRPCDSRRASQVLRLARQSQTTRSSPVDNPVGTTPTEQGNEGT